MTPFRPVMATAALLVLTASPVAAQEPVRPVLTAEQCQPLTDANYEMCCIALNRDEILSRELIGQCPPITTALIQRILQDADGEDGPTERGPQTPAPGKIPTPPTDGDPNANININAGRGDGGEDRAGNTYTSEAHPDDEDPGRSGAHNNAGHAGSGPASPNK